MEMTFLLVIPTLIFFMLSSMFIIPFVAEQDAKTQVSIINIIFFIVTYFKSEDYLDEEDILRRHCMPRGRCPTYGINLNFGMQSAYIPPLSLEFVG